MNKKSLYTLCCAGIFMLMAGGCAAGPQPLYHYGNYSNAYYAFKKEPGEKGTEALKSSIEQVIETSNANGMRVPPGMFANLGYIYLKANNPAQAVENFEKEKALYPEAAHFMDRMIAKTRLAHNEEGGQK